VFPFKFATGDKIRAPEGNCRRWDQLISVRSGLGGNIIADIYIAEATSPLAARCKYSESGWVSCCDGEINALLGKFSMFDTGNSTGVAAVVRRRASRGTTDEEAL
jgi:hypothetical protein